MRNKYVLAQRYLYNLYVETDENKYWNILFGGKSTEHAFWIKKDCTMKSIVQKKLEILKMMDFIEKFGEDKQSRFVDYMLPRFDIYGMGIALN